MFFSSSKKWIFSFFKGIIPLKMIYSSHIRSVYFKWARSISIKLGGQNLAKRPITNLTRPSRSSRHMHSQFYYQPFARTNCYNYSFIPNTVYDWNHLPQDIINVNFVVICLSLNLKSYRISLRPAAPAVIIRQCCINLIKGKWSECVTAGTVPVYVTLFLSTQVESNLFKSVN